jgi:membrane protease YdiL (CAAX protease family)
MGDLKATTQEADTSGGLRRLMRKRPLLFFFLIAYAFSWVLSIPAVLSTWGILPPSALAVFFIIKSFGPYVAASVVTRAIDGREGMLRLRRSVRQVRVDRRWYVLILIGIPAVMLVGLGMLPGALASFQGLPPKFLATYAVTFILIFFGGGPLGEEPGWRGFALPRMQPLFGPLWATLLLGVAWAFWHLPDFLMTAQRGGPGADYASLFAVNFPIFLVMVLAMSVIFTWVFNRTRGSVFIAILLHTSINAFGTAAALFSAPIVTGTDLFVCVAFVVPALLIIGLTRGRLGYETGRARLLLSEQSEGRLAS